jgi:hypothetical protein
MIGPNEKECGEENEESSKKDKPSYYYDDAHGYEEYDPKKDADSEEDDEFDD